MDIQRQDILVENTVSLIEVCCFYPFFDCNFKQTFLLVHQGKRARDPVLRDSNPLADKLPIQIFTLGRNHSLSLRGNDLVHESSSHSILAGMHNHSHGQCCFPVSLNEQLS